MPELIGSQNLDDNNNFVESSIVTPVNKADSYGVGYRPNMYSLDDELNEYKASNQSNWDKFGKAVVRGVGKAAISTVEPLGYLLDTEHWMSNINKTHDEYSNWFNELLREGENALDEAMPIYTKDEKPDIGTSDWWFKNGDQILKSIGYFVPGMAMTRGASMLLKGMGVASKARNIIAPAMSATAMNYSEHMVSATQAFKENKQSYLDAGWDAEKATAQASKDAAGIVQKGKFNILLNYLEYSNLFKVPRSTRRFTDASKKAAAKTIGKEALETTAEATRLQKFANASQRAFGTAKRSLTGTGKELTKATTLGEIGISGLSEGWEEVNTGHFESEARRDALLKTGQIEDDGSTSADRYFEHLGSYEGITEGLLGALGGSGMQVMSNLMQYKDRAAAKDRIQKNAEDIGDFKKFNDTKADDRFKLYYDNATAGTYESVINNLEAVQNITSDEAKELQLEDDYITKAQEYITEAKEFEEDFEQLRNEYQDTPQVANALIINGFNERVGRKNAKKYDNFQIDAEKEYTKDEKANPLFKIKEAFNKKEALIYVQQEAAKLYDELDPNDVDSRTITTRETKAELDSRLDLIEKEVAKAYDAEIKAKEQYINSVAEKNEDGSLKDIDKHSNEIDEYLANITNIDRKVNTASKYKAEYQSQADNASRYISKIKSDFKIAKEEEKRYEDQQKELKSQLRKKANKDFNDQVNQVTNKDELNNLDAITKEQQKDKQSKSDEFDAIETANNNSKVRDNEAAIEEDLAGLEGDYKEAEVSEDDLAFLDSQVEAMEKKISEDVNSLNTGSDQLSNKSTKTDTEESTVKEPSNKVKVSKTSKHINYSVKDIEKQRKDDLNHPVPVTNYLTGEHNAKDALLKLRTYLTDVLGWDNMPIGFSNKHITLDYLNKELQIPASIIEMGGGALTTIEVDIKDVINAKYDAELEELKHISKSTSNVQDNVQSINKPIVDNGYINHETNPSSTLFTDIDALYSFAAYKIDGKNIKAYDSNHNLVRVDSKVVDAARSLAFLSQGYLSNILYNDGNIEVKRFTANNYKNKNLLSEIESGKINSDTKVRLKVDTEYAVYDDNGKTLLDSYEILRNKYKSVYEWIQNVPISIEVYVGNTWKLAGYVHETKWIASIDEKDNIIPNNVAPYVEEDNNAKLQYDKSIEDRSYLYNLLNNGGSIEGNIQSVGFGHPIQNIKVDGDDNTISAKTTKRIGKTTLRAGRPLIERNSVGELCPNVNRFYITGNGLFLTGSNSHATDIQFEGSSVEDVANKFPGTIYMAMTAANGIKTALPAISPSISFLNSTKGSENNVYGSLLNLIKVYFSQADLTDINKKAKTILLDRETPQSIKNILEQYLYLHTDKVLDGSDKYYIDFDTNRNTLIVGDHSAQIKWEYSLENGKTIVRALNNQNTSANLVDKSNMVNQFGKALQSALKYSKFSVKLNKINKSTPIREYIFSTKDNKVILKHINKHSSYNEFIKGKLQTRYRSIKLPNGEYSNFSQPNVQFGFNQDGKVYDKPASKDETTIANDLDNDLKDLGFEDFGDDMMSPVGYPEQYESNNIDNILNNNITQFSTEEQMDIVNYMNDILYKAFKQHQDKDIQGVSVFQYYSNVRNDIQSRINLYTKLLELANKNKVDVLNLSNANEKVVKKISESGKLIDGKITKDSIETLLDKLNTANEDAVWNELVKLSKAQLKSYGIDVRTDTDISEDSLYETEKYDENARFKIDPKLKVSASFKLFLAQLSDCTYKDGKSIVNSTVLGTNKLVNVNEVFDNLRAMLVNNGTTIDSLIEALNDNININFNYKSIANYLTKNKHTKLATEFLNIMSNTRRALITYKSKPIYVEEETYPGVFQQVQIGTTYIPIVNNSIGGYKETIKDWIEYQKTLPIVNNVRGKLKMNLDAVNDIKSEYIELLKTYKNRYFTDDFIHEFTDILNKLGLDVSFEAIRIYADNKNNSFLTQLGLVNNKGNENTTNLMGSIFTSFTRAKTDTSRSNFDYNNPLFNNQVKLNINPIAKTQFKLNNKVVGNGSLNKDNEFIFEISHYAHLYNTFRRLFKSNDSLLSDKTKTNFGANSIYKDSFENAIGTDKYGVNIFDAFGVFGSKTSKSRMELTDSEMYLLPYVMFQNGGNKNIARYIGSTLSDSSQSPIYTLPKVKTDFIFDGNKIVGLAPETLDTLMKSARNEINRIVYASENLQNRDEYLDYVKGATTSFLFPYLNDFIKSKTAPDGRVILTSEDFNTIEDLIEQNIIDKINKASSKLIELGIINYNKGELTSIKFDYNYYKNIRNNNKALNNHAKTQYAIADFIVNDTISRVEQYIYFNGDPAIYTKVKNNKVDINATISNMEKRLKGLISPYETGNFTTSTYNRATISDRYIPSKLLKEYIDRGTDAGYEGLNTGDAQEWATVKEAIEFKKAYNLIEPDVYDSISKKLNDAIADKNNVGNYYKLTDKEVDVLLQIDKPVSFTSKYISAYDFNDIVFRKSGAMVLLPEVTANLQIDKIRVAMENQGIDRLAFESADKVGANTITKAWDEKGNVLDDITFDKMIMSREDIGLQQRLPTGKEKINIVSQMNKLLFNNIRDLRFDITTNEVKTGVNTIFKTNDELAKIGTQEQYSEYLNSIFPDSKVKEVLYHGSTEDRWLKYNNASGEYEVDTSKLSMEDGMHFGTKVAATDRIESIRYNADSLITETSDNLLLPVLLNIKNTEEVVDAEENWTDTINKYKDSNKILEYTNTTEDKGSKSYIAFNDKDVHVLGSKQDVANFKKYVKSNPIKSITGRDLELQKEKIRKELFKIGQQELIDEFNIVNENGTLVIKDIAKLKDRILKEAEDRNWGLSDIQQIQVENSEFVFPLLYSNSYEKIQSLLLNIITSNIIKTKIKGKGYIQATNAGFTETKVIGFNDLSAEEQDKITNRSSIVYTSEWDGESLKHTRIRDNKGKPSQVFVAWNFRDNYGNLLDINNYTKKVNGKTIIYFDKIPQKLLQGIGARIPNQSHSSMFPFEVVGFLPPSMADTIILADDIVNQTGSDFDIDKLYGYLNQYFKDSNNSLIPLSEDTTKLKLNNIDARINKLEELGIPEQSEEIAPLLKEKYELSIEKKNIQKDTKSDIVSSISNPIRLKEINRRLNELTDEIEDYISETGYNFEGKEYWKLINEYNKLSDISSRSNILKQQYVDVHWQVLTNPNVIDLEHSRLDKEDIADEFKLLVDQKDNDVTDYTYAIESYKSQNEGKSLVAVTSLYNIFNSTVQPLTDINCKRLLKYGKTIPLNLEFKNEDGSIISLNQLNGTGTSYYNGELRSKSDNIVLLQNAAVDNANKPYLGGLNINNDTISVAATLMMLEDYNGNALDISFATRIMTQPIIRDLINTVKVVRSEGNIIGNSEVFKEAFNIVNKKYRAINSKAGIGNLPLSSKELKDLALSKDTKSADYISKQLQVLSIFKTIFPVASEVNKTMTSTLFASRNGAGKSITDGMTTLNTIESVIDSDYLTNVHKILGELNIVDDKIKGIIYDTEDGAATEDALIFSNNVLSELFGFNNSFYDLSNQYNESAVSLLREELGVVGELSGSQLDHFIKESRKYVLSGTPELLDITEVNTRRAQLLLDRKNNKSLGTRIQDYLKLNDNLLLSNYLTIERSENTANPVIIKYNNMVNGKNINDQWGLQMFNSILQSEDEVLKDIGKDLVQYAYLMGGTFTPISFVNLINSKYLKDIGFDSSLRNVDLGEPAIFLEQYFQHHPNRAQSITDYGYISTANSNKTSSDPNTMTQFRITITKDQDVPPTYISQFANDKIKLFKCIDKDVNDYAQNEFNYVQIDTLGSANNKISNVNHVVEYSKDTLDQKSIIRENKAPGVKIQVAKTNKTSSTLNSTNYTIGNDIKTNAKYFKEGTMKYALKHIDSNKSFGTVSTILYKYAIRKNINVECLVSNLNENVSGVFRDNKIHINNNISVPKQYRQYEIERTISHESVHAIYKYLINNHTSGKLSEYQYNIISNLKNTFTSAKNELYKDPKVKAILDKLDAFQEDNSIKLNSEEVKYYGFTNIHEFISEILTRREFQELTNNIKYTGTRGNLKTNKSILAKIMDMLKELIISIGEDMGINIKSDMLLNAALEDILALTVDYDNIGDSRQDSSTIEDNKVSNRDVEIKYDTLNSLMSTNEKAYWNKIDKLNKQTTVNTIEPQPLYTKDTLLFKLQDMGLVTKIKYDGEYWVHKSNEVVADSDLQKHRAIVELNETRLQAFNNRSLLGYPVIKTKEITSKQGKLSYIVTIDEVALNEANKESKGRNKDSYYSPMSNINNPIQPELSRELETLVLTLEDRIRDLEYKVTSIDEVGFDNIQDRNAKITQRIKMLKDQKDYIYDNASLESITKVASQQLTYVANYMNSEVLDHRDVKSLNDIIEIWKWGNSSELYLTKAQIDNRDSDYHKVFQNINKEAETLSTALNNKSIDLLRATIKEQTGLTVDAAQIKEIDDISGLTSYLLDATKVKNPTIKTLANILKNSENNQTGLILSIQDEITELFKPLDKYRNKIGNNYELFWDLDSEGNPTGGMTSKNTQKWIDFEKRQKLRWYNLYRQSRTSETLDTADKILTAKQIISDDRKNTITIDLVALKDADGVRDLPGYTFESRQSYIDYLKDEFGEQETKTLINTAKELHTKYIADLNAQERYINSDDTIEDKEAAINDWIDKHSPVKYLNNLYSGDTIDFSKFNGYEYLLTVPRKIINGNDSGYYNPKYNTIANDPVLFNFYVKHNMLMGRLLNMLPNTVTKDLPSNFIANVRRKAAIDWSNPTVSKLTNYAKIKTIEAITSNDTISLGTVQESEKIVRLTDGSIKNNIPLKYLNLSNDAGYDKSYDLKANLELFANMAVNFAYKNEVEDVAVSIQNILKHSKELEKTSTNKTILNKLGRIVSKKDGVINTNKLIDHTLKLLLYEQGKEKAKASKKVIFTGKTKVTVDGINKEILKSKRATELKSRADKLNELLEDEFIDETTKMVYENELKELQKEYTALGGRSLSWDKVGDSLMVWTQLKGLGLNFTAGISNLIFGLISNMIHANGREDFNNKEILRALKLVLKSKSVVTNRYDNNKIYQIVKRYNILFDTIDSHNEHGIGNDQAKVKDRVTKFLGKHELTPYVFQTKTEYLVQSMSFIAGMIHTNVDGKYTKSGESMSMFDVYGNDGKPDASVLNESGMNYYSYILGPSTNNGYSKLRNRMIQVNKLLHGNYDPTSRPLLKRWVMGRMLLQFRSWLPEGFANRFQDSYYDVQMGRTVKGRWITYADLGLAQTAKTLLRQITYRNNAFMLKNGESMAREDIENMRRNLAELMSLGSTVLVMALLKYALSFDDDDDENPMYAPIRLLANAVYRGQQDIYMYISPQSLYGILHDPVPVTKVVIDYLSAIDKTYKYATQEDYKGNVLNGWLQTTPYVNQIPKVGYLSSNLLSE